MATLSLSQLFINLMSDGSYVAAGHTNPKRSNELTGSTHTYGTGRRRGLSSLGDIGQVSFTLNLVSASDVTKLDGWRGQAVQMRNYVGERWVGIYWKLDNIVPQKGSPGFYMVDIMMDTITWPSSV